MCNGKINKEDGGDNNKHEMPFPKFGNSFVPVLKYDMSYNQGWGHYKIEQ